MCHCDWVNKEADWPIAGLVEVRRDLQKKRESEEGKEESLRISRGHREEMSLSY